MRRRADRLGTSYLAYVRDISIGSAGRPYSHFLAGEQANTCTAVWKIRGAAEVQAIGQRTRSNPLPTIHIRTM